jgi:predicted transcriptional regulator
MAKRLSELQIAAIEYLALPQRGGLTYEEIAAKVGVSDRALRNWRNDDTFADALVKRTIMNAKEYLPEIMASIPRHIIEDGNAAMFRTYMQSIGALTDRVEVDAKGAGVDMDAIRAQIAALKDVAPPAQSEDDV